MRIVKIAQQGIVPGDSVEQPRYYGRHGLKFVLLNATEFQQAKTVGIDPEQIDLRPEDNPGYSQGMSPLRSSALRCSSYRNIVDALKRWHAHRNGAGFSLKNDERIDEEYEAHWKMDEEYEAHWKQFEAAHPIGRSTLDRKQEQKSRHAWKKKYQEWKQEYQKRRKKDLDFLAQPEPPIVCFRASDYSRPHLPPSSFFLVRDGKIVNSLDKL